MTVKALHTLFPDGNLLLSLSLFLIKVYENRLFSRHLLFVQTIL